MQQPPGAPAPSGAAFATAAGLADLCVCGRRRAPRTHAHRRGRICALSGRSGGDRLGALIGLLARQGSAAGRHATTRCARTNARHGSPTSTQRGAAAQLLAPPPHPASQGEASCLLLRGTSTGGVAQRKQWYTHAPHGMAQPQPTRLAPPGFSGGVGYRPPGSCLGGRPRRGAVRPLARALPGAACRGGCRALAAISDGRRTQPAQLLRACG